MTDARRGPVGQLDPRLRGRRTHLCAACDFPIAVYARCAPCLHAFCLTCAAAMPRCLICRAPVTKLERIPGEAGLFISPLTLQGFRSQADLARHAQQLQGTLAALLAAGAGAAIALPGGPGGMQAAGWKPPPPPGPPPPGTGIAGSGGSGYGRRQQYGVQPSRQGMGAVMRPR